MVIITSVYVIATIFICIFNGKAAKATREQIKESQLQFKESNRAVVNLTFEVIRNGLMVLRIKNNGNNLAKNIHVKLDEDFINSIPNEDDKESAILLNKSNFMLGKEQNYFLCLGSHVEFIDYKNKRITGNITYSDCFGDYDEEIDINFDGYSWATMYDSPENDIYCELKKSGETNKKIFNELSKINNSIRNLENND